MSVQNHGLADVALQSTRTDCSEIHGEPFEK